MEPAPLTEAQAKVTHVRGQGIINFRSTLKVAMYGGRWELLLERLSPPARALLEMAPTAEDWVDTQLLLEIHQAKLDIPHPDTRRVRGELIAEEEVKRRQVETSETATDPQAVIQQFPAWWAYSNQGGCTTIDSLTNGRSEISIWAIFPYPEFLRDVAPSMIRQAIAMAGAKEAKVDYLGPSEDDADYRHRYWLNWTPLP